MIWKNKPADTIRLPFDFAPGAAVDFDSLPLRVVSDSVVRAVTAPLTISAAGVFEISDDQYLVFLRGSEDSALELLVNKNNVDDVIALTVFRQLDEIYPVDEQELGDWICEENGMIGDAYFTTPDDVEYERYWAEPSDTKVRFKLNELRFCNSSLDKSEALTFEHQCMRYVRDMGEGDSEYLHVTSVDKGNSGVIEVWAGLSLPADALKMT